MVHPLSPQTLLAHIDDTHARIRQLVAGLDQEQMIGPRLPEVNPPLWETGHLAWFSERWILRHLDGRAPLLPQADALYDSSAIAHDRRWDLPLPTITGTLAYFDSVTDAIRQRLYSHGGEIPQDDVYFYRLALFHQDMHAEALTYTRQTLAYRAPPSSAAVAVAATGPLPGDAEIPGGRFMLGAMPDQAFAFDNETEAHPVELAPFRIARAPVTNAEYAAFVDEQGYLRHEFWDDAGWRWRMQAQADAPRYWSRSGGGWTLRRFDRWIPLPPDVPVMHVNWHEARAWCRWAGRRLPTEAEWEMAAACEKTDGCVDPARKRLYPWGNDPATAAHASLDGAAPGDLDVAALAAGDSAFGCRQMLGSIWEWTESTFEPYPGFSPGPYRDYSAPWFGTHKVLKGGSWATTARLAWNSWRNFFMASRNDIFAGFRTCAR